MSIYKDGRTFSCFVCGVHGSLVKLIELIDGISALEAIEQIKDQKSYVKTGALTSKVGLDDSLTLDQQALKQPEIQLPFFFTKISLKDDTEASWYLKHRHIDQEIVDMYDLRYSEWAKRVICPIQDHLGRLVGWQARDITGQNQIKIVTKPEGLRKSILLYNYHNILETQEDELTLAEGPFDCMKGYQINAVGMFGKIASNAQISLLSLNKGLRRVNLALDPDALVQTLNLASMLHSIYDVHIVELPEGRGDLGECTYEEAAWCAKRAVGYADFSRRLKSTIA